MTLRAFAATGLIVLVLAGCSSDDDRPDGAASTTSDRPASSTTTTTVIATTDATSQPSTTVPTAFPTEPQEYTADLVRAWGRGDRRAVERFAAGTVVDELFRYADPGGRNWDAEGCEGAGGTTYCRFLDPTRGVSVSFGIPAANGNVVDGPQEVVSVAFRPRP